MHWPGKKVIVTGGAGFIASNLIGRLLDLGAEVSAVDKLLMATQPWIWEAKARRLLKVYLTHGISNPGFHIMDLATERDRFELLARKHEIVFHMAAVFGGRQFVDKRQAECSRMLAIDANAIGASADAGIKKFFFSSSACVYPNSLNTQGYLLKEDDVLSTGEGWKSSDNLYGFAKLMGELECRVFHEERGMETSTARFLTVYGPGEYDTSHAISALIEKALGRKEPYVVWGSGRQERGFTYVDDIVDGCIKCVEEITDGTPINLGSKERQSISDVASLILEAADHHPKEVSFDTSMPEGPFSRALSISRAWEMLGWQPKVKIEEGLARTVEWHRQQREELVVRA